MKQINIFVPADDVKRLKDNNYKLCFSKKVNDSFNTIWEARAHYQQDEVFEWEPEYKIFVVEKPPAGESPTDPTLNVDSVLKIPMKLGETITLNDKMEFDGPVVGGEPESLTFINNFGKIYPGVTDKNGTPIYLAEMPVVLGKTELIPKDIISIWFQQDVETPTVISESISKGIIVDLTATDTVNIEYKDDTFILSE